MRLLLWGALAAGGYYLYTESKKTQYAGPRLAKVPGGVQCQDAKGTVLSMLECTNAEAAGHNINAHLMLEGYVSTGSPCCSNCSRGLRCCG